MTKKWHPDLPEETVSEIRRLYFIESTRAQLNGYLWQLNEAGWPLESMAKVLLCSRQRVFQRISNGPRSFEGLPAVPPVPPKPMPAPKPPKPERPRIPPETLEKLLKMHETARWVNGGTPADHPSRQVSVEYTALLAELVDRGISGYTIGIAMGIEPSGIYARLSRHGYRELPPSQAKHGYKGTPTGGSR